MVEIDKSRIQIISVGVGEYDDHCIKNLKGPIKDLEKIKDIFIENKKIALYDNNQYIELRNPNSQELRNAINDYVQSRSAERDILVFYFSGHGVSIGRDDFGFCVKDSILHQTSNVVIPSSVVRLSEILDSILLINATPIFIIDACYSGKAGKQLVVESIEAISYINESFHTKEGSSYALLCSCSQDEVSYDNLEGGVFSKIFHEVAVNGCETVSNSDSFLTLGNIYNDLDEKRLKYTDNFTPRLFLGLTLPKFYLCRNVRLKPQKYSLNLHLIKVIKALWNGGSEIQLTPSEIDNTCGKGAYGNHSKLSLQPWALVETIPGTVSRRLTKRGKKFIRGKIKVPKEIIQDKSTGNWNAVSRTSMVKYSDYD